jgi:hypothetical protein
MLQVLIDHGANLKEVNGTDASCVHIASFTGNEQVLQFLLKHGVRANSPEFVSLTPALEDSLCFW